MNIIKDSVFGEMTYRHTWKKTEVILGNILLNVIVKDSDRKGISDAQRKSYLEFKKSPETYIGKADEVLSKYISKTYPSVDTIKVKPISVLFRQNGVWGFLYPSHSGEDDGLSVRFENGQVIADTDDTLF